MRLSVLTVLGTTLGGLIVGSTPAGAVAPNRAPSVPTELSTSPATVCAAESYLRDETPVLSGIFADPDGHDVSARFEVVTHESRVWTSAYDAFAASGATHAVTVPSGVLTDGGTYAWRARGRDVNHRPGKWTSWCRFTIDTTAPELPKVTSATYSEDETSGGVGVTSRFGFASSSDTAAFRYSFNGATPEIVAPAEGGGTAAVSFTPAAAGAQRLTVEAIDRAGNVSDARRYWFGVAAPATGAFWRMNAGTGPEPDSTPEGAHPLNVPDGVAWVDGPFKSFAPDSYSDDMALEFDGTDGGATTTGPALDTSASFTMSAFVRVDDTSSVTRVAVSQDGELYGAAQLGQLASEDCPVGMTTCFGFWMRPDDTSARTAATSSRPINPGEWVLLAGVWDEPAQKMTLHTCALGTPPDGFPADSGVPAATSVDFASTGSSAGGRTRVGSGWGDGEEAHQWNGAIDDVRLYASVKSRSDIIRICSGDETY